MSTVVKEVEPDEISFYVGQSSYIRPVAWAAIYEDDELVGHGCVSFLHGKHWAHDLAHWGSSPTAIARLYKLLIRLSQERGVHDVYTDVSSEAMLKLYRGMGWDVASVVLKGNIDPRQK